jgi:hypothetical protein
MLVYDAASNNSADKYLLSVRTILKQLVKSHHSTSICRRPVAKPTGGNVEPSKCIINLVSTCISAERCSVED